MQLEDWLDDLCVRFIINLPPEELGSVERICFQVEEAQWFYEDFIRPLDPSLPSLSLKAFSLRIFQHCPLFSTWSAQHYTSAFAEFLAYKQRVPVRGAIMLSEDMNEVVLVKGWKKGANWSFPRGKINKDESDLDCAVREVYEETGFDIQAAGLVRPEKEMKYIEITMREQHMRLYVFRGVPRDTHFEPKTRKEISKIEWYKLTDLPTLKKKHAQHETQEENLALNANKFYMVAPFLHPLKKWIAQQKKRDNRHSSSHLAAPPMTADESATEGEPGPATYISHLNSIASPPVLSSLPEVAAIQSQQPVQDPSLHLKELLNIGSVPKPVEHSIQPPTTVRGDVAKSNALLSLLRSGSAAEMRASPHTPSESISIPHQQIDPEHTVSEAVQTQSQPPFDHQPRLPDQQQSLLNLFSRSSALSQQLHDPISAPPTEATMSAPKVLQGSMAPYQRTGDPQFTRQSPENTRSHVVPPANALPKLTHHTRALLDAFKAAPPQQPEASIAPTEAPKPQTISGQKALLDMLNTAGRNPQHQASVDSRVPTPVVNEAGLQSATPHVIPAQRLPTPISNGNVGAAPKFVASSSNASSLLELFRKPGEPGKASTMPKAEEGLPSLVPVELAAGPSRSPKPRPETNQSQVATTVLRKDAPKREPQARKAGETAATVDGPLNQPDFERVARSPQPPQERMRRSPVPAHRTLYDPKQPAPPKILQRSDENKRAVKSPRLPKTSLAASSPKQRARPKPEKSFQPQILRRPQTSDVPGPVMASPVSYTPPIDVPKPETPSLTPTPHLSGETPRRPSHQSDNQKQNLLSLLTGQAGPPPMSKSPRQVSSSSTVSPLTQSQVGSPLGEEPISTRSRMSSVASLTGGGLSHEGRPKIEKRQTTAGDKAFLLGYLGRIANQEGQSQ